jgi:hypothetical protein
LVLQILRRRPEYRSVHLSQLERIPLDKGYGGQLPALGITGFAVNPYSAEGQSVVPK